MLLSPNNPNRKHPRTCRTCPNFGGTQRPITLASLAWLLRDEIADEIEDENSSELLRVGQG
jgi:hypothetical protein